MIARQVLLSGAWRDKNTNRQIMSPVRFLSLHLFLAQRDAHDHQYSLPHHVYFQFLRDGNRNRCRKDPRPFVGVSLSPLTSIIGIVLAGISIGAVVSQKPAKYIFAYLL